MQGPPCSIPGAHPRGRHCAARVLLAAALLTAAAPLHADPAGSPAWQVEAVALSRLGSYRGIDGLRWHGAQVLLDPSTGRRLPGGIETRVLLSAGSLRTLTDARAGSFLILGPEFQRAWSWGGARGLLAGGISPTLLSQEDYAGRRLGGDFHFTSHFAAGLFLDRRGSWLLSYRVQHTSNGGLRRTNPGADLAGLELRWYGRR